MTGPFGYRDFRRYMGARVAATAATQIGSVAVGWRVYAMTHRAMDLGFVGLVQFLPIAGFSLAAGHVADRYDRRTVIAVCNTLIGLSWLSLAGLTLMHGSVLGIYAVLTVIAVMRAFSGPAGQALVPRLVPEGEIGRALAWSATLWQLTTVVGPSVGGLLYGRGGTHGPALAFGVAGTLSLSMAAQVASLHIRTGTSIKASPTLRDALAGVRYVRDHRLLLGTISLDLFAVLLGGAVALLPMYARDILHAGPRALGILRSAQAVGAAGMAAWLAHAPLRRRAGPWMLGCVLVFGLATVVFGLSRNIVVSVLALAVTGAVDMVSVVIRQHAVQIATPDAMRGRVSAVNLVFVGASNELGEFESGLTAAWLGPVHAVVLGGLGTCVVVALWAWMFPELRRLDRLDMRTKEG